jgi:hypothetical protein
VVSFATLRFAFTVNAFATPQAAALHALYPASDLPMVVERVNVVKRYATVLIRGGMMERSSMTAPILVEHFSFGWQAIDLVDYLCDVDDRVQDARDEALLTRGMPVPHGDKHCTGVVNDVGPPAQVEALRLRTFGPLVPFVAVVGDYALTDWFGAGGGQHLFRMERGRWQILAGGGGAMSSEDMREYNVPQADWCAFRIFDAKCPK